MDGIPFCFSIQTGKLAASELWDDAATVEMKPKDDTCTDSSDKLNPNCILEEPEDEKANNANTSSFKSPLPPDQQIQETKK